MSLSVDKWVVYQKEDILSSVIKSLLNEGDTITVIKDSRLILSNHVSTFMTPFVKHHLVIYWWNND